ncbi:VPLPA-CTERM sorting domain-containing protein [Roseibium aggregatum]|uniref:VPLPA-CTERM sorting domain-containing protein n=1 Tax=Roseibium aggregatum TaxID=187304 RepID=A0A939EH83_9HYPH|nr:VPLPA-CTERM sorting domain-containing protein [Roseibium aggregatum]MBN9672681.1 VPLPA-CTERM sorting domain-containing protein [Roseibium aggregatum]
MMKHARISIVAAMLAMVPFGANALTVSGTSAFDGGYATTITYDDGIVRSSANGRDNPYNALGAADGNFFEIGRNSSVDLTFGTLFDTSVTVFEITFGNVASYAESVLLSVGYQGTFTDIGSITNLFAQGGGTVALSSALGLFDTVRLTDTSTQGGGFDIDAVLVSPVTPVPLPAGLVLLGGGLAALGVFGRRKRAEA